MTQITIQRDVAKRQIAAARALLTFVGAVGQSPSGAIDNDAGDNLVQQLNDATEALARQVYTVAHAGRNQP